MLCCSQKLNRCDRFISPDMLASIASMDLIELKPDDVVAVRYLTEAGDYCIWYGMLSKCFVRPGWTKKSSDVRKCKGLILGADRIALCDQKAFSLMTWFVRLTQTIKGDLFNITTPWTPRLGKVLGRGDNKTTKLSVFKRLDLNCFGRIGLASEARASNMMLKVRMHHCQVKGHESNGRHGKGELYVLSAEDEDLVNERFEKMQAELKAENSEDESSEDEDAANAGAYGAK